MRVTLSVIYKLKCKFNFHKKNLFVNKKLKFIYLFIDDNDKNNYYLYLFIKFNYLII